MSRCDSIVVLGPSGAGKTTLVNGVRTPEYRERLFVPKRFVTRPERKNDDTEENTHVTREAFESGVKDGLIDPHWDRELDDGRTESYGFYAARKSRVRVYSANNDFLRNRNPSVQRVLENGLVVMACADDDVREERLKQRSPDMSDAERAVRLGDNGEDLLKLGIPIEVIDTSDRTPEESQQLFRGIVDSVI